MMLAGSLEHQAGTATGRPEPTDRRLGPVPHAQQVYLRSCETVNIVVC
jgi:hypothetical protein